MCVFVHVLGECYLCMIVDGQYLLEARVATLCEYEFLCVKPKASYNGVT